MSSITTSRYVNIDALRGIAAFLVVLFHQYSGGWMFKIELAPENLGLSTLPYIIPAFGYTGVYLFFVISGFCIHLRWTKAQKSGKTLVFDRKNFGSFWWRRFTRLYPAYIAAMVLFMWWRYSLGTLQTSTGDLISHFFMVHNFFKDYVFSLNGVFWTLAIEEQLYLIYFLLLWLRKKGWTLALTVCFLARFFWIGVTVIVNRFYAIEIPTNEGTLANWWIWALGAVAVENYLGLIKFPKWCYSLSLSLGVLLLAGGLHYAGVQCPESVSAKISFLFEPVLWGAGFFLLVNRVMQSEGKIKNISAKKAVAFIAWVGLFSYSLYLTHEFILELFHNALSNFMIIFLALLFAYSFYLIFERPLMIFLQTGKLRFFPPKN